MTTQPYADLSNALGTVDTLPVRGRLVFVPKELDLNASTPWGDFSQQEIKLGRMTLMLKGEGDVHIDLGEVACDDEGYVDARLELSVHGLAPGRYTLEACHAGAPVGEASVRLLGRDHQELVVRSDIDKTYLDTRFERKRDALGLLFQNAHERAVLPAMESVYRALQRGSDGQTDRAMVFLSGSPRFFKRVLEARIALDGIVQHGVWLKPFKEIAARNAAQLSVRNIIPALKEQIGYKLTWMLTGRLELPRVTPEILMGDDSEADFVVYNLYHQLTARETTPTALMETLGEMRIARAWMARIAPLADAVVTWLDGQPAPVRAIYINKTGCLSASHDVQAWLTGGLTRLHDGAWPLMLDLYEEGLVSGDAVEETRQRLRDLSVTDDALLLQAYEALEAGDIDMDTFEAYHLGALGE